MARREIDKAIRATLNEGTKNYKVVHDVLDEQFEIVVPTLAIASCIVLALRQRARVLEAHEALAKHRKVLFREQREALRKRKRINPQQKR